MTADEPTHKPGRSVPAPVVVVLGAIATGAALIWVSSLRDDVSSGLLDEPTANILVALLGTVGTVLTIVLQRAGEIRHQVKNSHGSNLRDDIDKLDAKIAAATETAQHAVRAARKASDDTVQLREDVQAGRLETGEVRADVRGLRKDIGRLTDAITKKESP
ncbi:DUF2746 domain-containing protein [Microbacterium resistens]|uniref:DUF2746 domain-containing protein n=1 Tax=Microbacterium resistens TaxID=156977 RepID=A0ABY3RQF3_9MICO|nr:DUF2746 domain-containing protein [Microbacterium resistens]UGS26313.1 DUF2746 domain-containing protein [Microbacterium resistens]